MGMVSTRGGPSVSNVVPLPSVVNVEMHRELAILDAARIAQ